VKSDARADIISEKSDRVVTRTVTFRGTVQGVGFRPTVAKLARRFGIVGQVRNMGGLVQIVVTDTKERIDAFVRLIEENKPPAANIVRVDIQTIDTVRFRDFTIARSGKLENEAAVIPSDIAVCENCLREFYDEKNPRYQHPFISCADCGPRFTVMERLPYDRDTTTMDDFEMCDFCAREYAENGDRRFHAQTISCHACGPMPRWFSAEEAVDAPDRAMREAICALRRGGVVAIKGVGGYYFACSPFDAAAVRKIREIKIREEKPFAVLFRDVYAVRDYCAVGEAEAELLRSPARPIVLLEQTSKDDCTIKSLDAGVCNNSRFVGAFLPSMGLQYLLLDAVGPLVMTSANLSDLPIIRADDVMQTLVSQDRRVAGMLYNERRIIVSVDDSVLRVIAGAPQMIRRAKGCTPTPVFIRNAETLTASDQIFATGGQLKSAFSLSKGNFAYMSQHLGDLDSIESEDAYLENFRRMKQFFDIEPGLVVCDMHPRYYTTKFAEEYARTARVELLRVQHHHAHTASVMAEHGLQGPVVGVSFDGTGYGTDGKIWGGEILICEGAEFGRYAHLRYVRLIGGDASMQAGWKSALSHVLSRANSPKNETDDARVFDVDISRIIAYSEREGTLDEFGRQRPQIEAAIRAGVNTVESSSMGRLFDGVASLLGIHHVNRYEGECAILLENAAAAAMEHPGADEACDLALGFHRTVAAAILAQCEGARAAHKTSTVALSGGVFQNKILMEETLALLRAHDFETYCNIAVPPNDGGIALGQNYIGMKYKEK
jgi:hydrogenase maturation protein HypF